MTSKSDVGSHFSRQASDYAVSISHASGDDLEVLTSLANPQPDDVCLDLATGPGHTAFHVAPHARFVIGLDIAPGMVDKAAELQREKDIHNVLFMLGDCHDLPFPDQSFNLITCRIAPHHFADLHKAMLEVARCLACGGRFVLEDSLGADDAPSRDLLNELERFRDPTHVKSLSIVEWKDVLEGANLRMTECVRYRKTRSFRKWVERAGMVAEKIDELAAAILDAPVEFRQTFFEIEQERVLNFTDEKLICRAERMNGGGESEAGGV